MISIVSHNKIIINLLFSQILFSKSINLDLLMIFIYHLNNNLIRVTVEGS